MARYPVSVDVVIDGPISEDQSDELLTACEPDSGALSATDPDVSPGRLTLIVDVASSSLRAAAGRGHDRVLALVEQVGLKTQSVERLEVMTEDAQATAPHVIPELVSQTDIAHMFDISRQRVIQLRQKGHLPDPVMKLSGGHVWVKADVVEASKHWNRRASVHATAPAPPDPARATLVRRRQRPEAHVPAAVPVRATQTRRRTG